ncbi:hypothetical protein T484DRAFT_1931425 [Baffinella frigidus]|nr:hypothetical protein T484DRAFT_1931425 [Cryptophyta sp. CCMP2293]
MLAAHTPSFNPSSRVHHDLRGVCGRAFPVALSPLPLSPPGPLPPSPPPPPRSPAHPPGKARPLLLQFPPAAPQVGSRGSGPLREAHRRLAGAPDARRGSPYSPPGRATACSAAGPGTAPQR